MNEQQSKKKGGRPKKIVTRSKQLGIRFTADELQAISQKAAAAGCCVTEFIRKTSLKGVVISRLTREEKQIANDLKAIGNNLNQIAKKAKQEGILTAVLLFESYRDFLDSLIKKFNHDQ